MLMIDDQDDNSNTDQMTDDWKKYYQKGGKGKDKHILMNIRNAYLVVENDEHFKGKLCYNEMKNAGYRKLDNGELIQIDDDYFVDSQIYMQNNTELSTIKLSDVEHAIKHNCMENKFHPVRDYLDKLIWDRIKRLDSWFHVYLGTPDTAYEGEIGKFTLIAAVARIYEPGCKCDYMTVLEGEQGIGKSETIKILAGGPEFFSDSLTGDIHSKDTADHISRNWMVEESELNTQGKIAAEAWKAFVTRTHERFRRPWGKVEEMRPRQCLIWGTTNQDRYIKDDSGGRRFWGVKCGEIDLEALRANRDQLFAEAIYLYEAGYPWWPDKEFEENWIRKQQEKRQQIDEWLNVILHYFEVTQKPPFDDMRKIRIADIWNYPLGQLGKPISRADQARISSLLHHQLKAPSGHDRRGTWFDLKAVL